MTPSAEVLSLYPADIATGPWEDLPNTAGLSGAKLWRSPLGWRLKAWPRDDVSADHLRQTHLWMRQAAALDFVPSVLPTRTNETVVVDGDWLWDLVTWMPGDPLLHEATTSRLSAAGRALAALHGVWRPIGRIGPCPAAERRLKALGRNPDLDNSPARPLIEAYRRHRAACQTALTRCRRDDIRLHPCLCDVRTDHVLFTGDRVTGLIDFGAVQIDHPAVDLARLLGDCLPGDSLRWQPLIDGYHSLQPLTPADQELIAVLERTGAVVSLLTWIDRLRDRPLTTAENERVAKLMARCERL